MALPSDYWRNPQMHNVFRTKLCQRFIRGGVCAWGSQCQFSHSLDVPRRPHKGHQYSPELCPHIKARGVGDSRIDGRIEDECPAGQKCNFAHSKEEVLYHPHILKTCLCEEHASRQGSSSRVRRKKRYCHRHYCPFAHGAKELRASPLPADVLKQCFLDALNSFPSNRCCKVCDPQQISEISPQPTTFVGCERVQRDDCRDPSFVFLESAPSHVGEDIAGSAAVVGASAEVLTKPSWPAAATALVATQHALGSAGENRVCGFDATAATQMFALQGISLPPGLDDVDSGPTRIGSSKEEEDTDDSFVPTPPGEQWVKDRPLLFIFASENAMAKDVSLFSTEENFAGPGLEMNDWKQEEERLAEFLGL